jgi:hypothetical protein
MYFATLLAQDHEVNPSRFVSAIERLSTDDVEREALFGLILHTVFVITGNYGYYENFLESLGPSYHDRIFNVFDAYHAAHPFHVHHTQPQEFCASEIAIAILAYSIIWGEAGAGERPDLMARAASWFPEGSIGRSMLSDPATMDAALEEGIDGAFEPVPPFATDFLVDPDWFDAPTTGENEVIPTADEPLEH